MGDFSLNSANKNCDSNPSRLNNTHASHREVHYTNKSYSINSKLIGNMVNINQNGSDNSKTVFTQAKDCIKTTHRNLNDDDVRTNSLVNSVIIRNKV
jgi:hypothetical protein